MIQKYLNRLQYIDQLIRLESTGNAYELGQKLNISRRHVYRLLEEMRDLGATIIYSRCSKSFIYSKPCKIEISLKVIELTQEEYSEINGGYQINSYSAIFCHKAVLSLYKQIKLNLAG